MVRAGARAGCGCMRGLMVSGLPVWVAGCMRWLLWGVPGRCAACARGRAWLWWRGCEAGEGFAAPAACSGREPGLCSLGVLVLADVVGGQDALVADGEQAGGEERDRGESHEAAPAAADVVGGGVFGGGEGPLGGGAAGVGPAVRGGGVVVFLRGLGGDVRWHGDGLLGAAGRRVLRRAEDLGPLVAQGH